jgi:hypothetical protein
MEKMTLIKAREIASRYFKLLIDKYEAQGFQTSVIEREDINLNKDQSVYYLLFTKQNVQNKLYEIKNNKAEAA